jgi:glucose/arabinose dehydrogenase
MRTFWVAAGLLTLALAACGKPDPLPPGADIGPNPVLPEPHYAFFPSIKIAPPVGWPGDQAPTPAPGLAVTKFAGGLHHPRWLYELPNGDVLVAEATGPKEAVKRPKDLVMAFAMRKAGSGGGQTQRIILLRDADRDGIAETRTKFIDGLNSAFGMALIGDQLFVANTDALLRFPYRPGATAIPGKGVKVTDLPAGPINHHWTKNVIASRDGKRLYVTVGSNSNAGENGMDQEVRRAAILEVDPATGASRLFASGLRNPNGMDWEPSTGALWTVVNERDEIGDDLVPDYITSVRPGGFYGWPYSYFGQHIDKRPYPARPDLVARAIRPDYAVGNHGGSLGFAFSNATALTPRFREGAFVSQHGSWNRQRPFGYRVIFVPFRGGRPSGMPVDVLTGFLAGGGKSHGRPVGVIVDRGGGLLVADDAGNAVWRVAAGR